MGFDTARVRGPSSVGAAARNHGPNSGRKSALSSPQRAAERKKAGPEGPAQEHSGLCQEETSNELDSSIGRGGSGLEAESVINARRVPRPS
jgi:hypothetical protein